MTSLEILEYPFYGKEEENSLELKEGAAEIKEYFSNHVLSRINMNDIGYIRFIKHVTFSIRSEISTQAKCFQDAERYYSCQRAKALCDLWKRMWYVRGKIRAIMFREIISVLRVARTSALRSALSAKSQSHVSPECGRQRGTRRTRKAPGNTRHGWKKLPDGIVELWLWWYWQEFWGKSRYRLAGSRCHSCENPKTRRYYALGTTYISSPARTRTYIHVHTTPLMLPILLFERSDQRDPMAARLDREKMISLSFSILAWNAIRDTCGGTDSAETYFTRDTPAQQPERGLSQRLISIGWGLCLAVYPSLDFLPSWTWNRGEGAPFSCRNLRVIGETYREEIPRWAAWSISPDMCRCRAWSTLETRK